MSIIKLQTALLLLLLAYFTSLPSPKIVSTDFAASADVTFAMYRAADDTTDIRARITQAQNLMQGAAADPKKSKQILLQTLDEAKSLNYNRGVVESSLLLGNILKSEAEYAKALDYYLKANTAVVTGNDPYLTYRVYSETSLLYQDWNVYEKALEYLTRALTVSEELGDQQMQIRTLQLMAVVSRTDNRNEKAVEYYGRIKELAQQINDENMLVSASEGLISIFINTNNMEKAQLVCSEMLELKRINNDQDGMAYYHNKLGIIYKNQKLYQPALLNFTKALELMQASGKSEQQQIPLLLSIGVMQQVNGEYENAVLTFESVVEIARNANDANDLIKSLNYLIAIHIGMRQYDKAGRYTNEILKRAEAIDDKLNLEKNYLRLAEIEEITGHTRKALAAYKKYLEVKEAFYEEQQEEQQNLLNRQLEAEKKEKELKLLVVDQELQKVALEKLQIEAERKEQQLALLQQQKELQESRLKTEQLERERVQQALTLTEERLKAEQRKQEVETLQKERELQELAFKQKELEEQEKAREIELLEKNNELLEADRKLQEQKLEEEASMRKYGIGIIGLILLVLGIVGFSFIQKQKANKKLKQQQAEIERKNTILAENEKQLMASMKELADANTLVEAQKEDLENTNLRLTDSIKYAERIQTAILPAETKLAAAFKTHFFVYHPKDLVSGDFYWFSKRGDVAYIAAVDCTGHGVPGAFMSMIGNTLLNQIVNEKGVEKPSEILNTLHQSVRESLNQQDSSNVDGMDVGLCRIEPAGNDKFNVQFSGAKCPMIYFSDNATGIIKPDRISIGGWRKEEDLRFTNQQLTLNQKDKVYLPTDGIIDMANAKRQRLGTRKLQSLLARHAHRPLYEQKLQIENFIGEYQEGTDQRDDITLVAFEL